MEAFAKRVDAEKLLRSIGDWGVPQQAASGNVDSQMHCLQQRSFKLH